MNEIHAREAESKENVIVCLYNHQCYFSFRVTRVLEIEKHF
jgi:hypothetical protein